MEGKETVKIVIADDYMEIYAPLPRDPKEADKKVKIGMLKKAGLDEEQIEALIDLVEIEFDGGADGRFDDGPYTPIKLVMTIDREKPEEPIEIPEDEEEKPQDVEKRQTMLKQYYGDRKLEARRREIFARFKSHIVQKPVTVYDRDGNPKEMTLYTIEDYDKREKDSNELLLDGYKTRLEKLSRAHQGDFSPYERQLARLHADALKEIMEKYEEMHKVDPKGAEKFKKSAMEEVSVLRDEEFKKKAIQALIDQDTEFIETNNYGYNSIQNTAKNLETLGKLGEKGVRAQVSDEQSKLQKMGLHTLNAIIEIRNHTTAPVNKAIGTFVAAPIYRRLFSVLRPKSKAPVSVNGYLITPMEDMIATSQKNAKGMFKNKPSHRYHARKDYFIEQEKMEMSARQSEETPEGKDGKGQVKRTTIGQIFRLAIVPRLKAIVSYKEGNVAVLNAGLDDLVKSASDRKLEMRHKDFKIESTKRRIDARDEEIAELKFIQNTLKNSKNEKLKEQVEKALEIKEHELLILEARLSELRRTEIDSIQTDAVSMSQHDKANKATMTEVVKGVKTAGRIAVGTFISRYLYREIAHQARTPDRYQYVPGESKTIEEEVTRTVTETVPGLDEKGIGNITFGEIYSKSSGDLFHHVVGGDTIPDKTSFFRGLAFKYNGRTFSGSDGKGFDPTKLTGVKIDQELSDNTSMVAVVQEVLRDSTGQDFTESQIEKLIANGEISGFSIWRSRAEEGVPSGWLNASEIVPDLISTGSHEITREVTDKITKVIETPGKYIKIPGTDYTYTTIELNPVVIAAEAGLGAMEALELSDLLRYTRSQESLQRRQPKLLEAMKAENDRRRAEKKKTEESKETEEADKGESSTDKSKGKSQTKVKKLRDIVSYQRNNKSKVRRYTYSGREMQEATKYRAEHDKRGTAWERFYGTKREDLASGYDENAINANDKFEERE